jgi:hypothetical protein
MKNRRIRHLPLVEGQDWLPRLIYIGDLNAFEADGQKKTLQLLNEYFYGRV